MRYISILLIAVGCGGDPLSDADDIAGWANASSALGVFTVGYEPIAFADGQLEFDDATCPTTSDDGTTVVITGDCEDSEGRRWFGTATLVRGASGERNLTLDEYGDDRLGGPRTDRGTFDVTEVEADVHTFDVDVTRTGGSDTEIVYSGVVEGGYDGPTVWSGSGRISRDGFGFNSGSVDAATIDQLRDNSLCAGEALSGSTELTSTDHTVVITYDGEVDCDDDDSAKWSRDGADQGLVAGVTCSTGGAPGLGGLCLVALVAIGMRRRRERLT